MTDIELSGSLNIPFQSIDGEINAKSSEDFVEQFRKLFSSPAARESRSVVYIWSTESGIPRMSGKSNVIYIGQTRLSLFERHHRYAEVEGSSLNWKRSQYIIETFGPIRVKFAVHQDPRKAEKALLRCYMEEHLELPPINSNG